MRTTLDELLDPNGPLGGRPVMADGATGSPPAIGPNDPLTFIIEILETTEETPAPPATTTTVAADPAAPTTTVAP